jgi:LPXTG-site transpeptidase (sortase) family protein
VLNKGRHSRGRAEALKPRRFAGRGRIATAAGIIIVLGVGSWQAYASLWTLRADRVGSKLVQQERARARQVAQSHGHGAALCSKPTPSTTAPPASAARGLLEIPTLGVVAPVLQGTGDGQLAVAVGHDPSSVWPGATGTAVFLAHDVSYFAHIDKLSIGDQIQYVTPCTTYTYKVSGHRVVPQGSPVYATPGRTILLGTCWPTDALWYTPYRLLVTATETSVVSNVHKDSVSTSGPPDLLSVPVPAALEAQGLTLSTNSILIGTMTAVGSPAKGWEQSPAPMDVEGAALKAYFAGVHSLAQDRSDWWRSIAPTATMPAALVGTQISQYLTRLDVAISVTGESPTSVQLSAEVGIAGGPHPGTYTMTVVESVSGSELTVSSWGLTPA